MSAQPATRPETAFQARPQHAAYRKPEEAILFFGHLLDAERLQGSRFPANAMPGSPIARALRRSASECGRILRSALRGIRTWRDRAYGRRRLVELDERLRKDIGLTAVDIWRESHKPFWRG